MSEQDVQDMLMLLSQILTELKNLNEWALRNAQKGK